LLWRPTLKKRVG